MKNITLFLAIIFLLVSCYRRIIVTSNYYKDKLPSEYSDTHQTSLLFIDSLNFEGDSSILFGHVLDLFDFSPTPGCIVTLNNTLNNVTYNTLTDFQGNFIFYPEEGHYKLSTHFICYDSLLIDDIFLKNKIIKKVIIGLRYNAKCSDELSTENTAHNTAYSQ